MKSLRKNDFRTLIVVLLFGFYGQFVIVNQSQPMIIYTLNASLSSNNNNNTPSIIVSNSSNIPQPFQLSYKMLINESYSLTQSYQKEIGKWQSRQYDNKTMILITDNYLPKFQKLVNRAASLQPTTYERVWSSIN
ncbi:MAG TPA: hypothetical protein VE223_05590 [Nitrososphaeraceae archaeon]|nr:hypothetical protein [Nitrososphaeraceae archaeon]